jgi:hypothetical protein
MIVSGIPGGIVSIGLLAWRAFALIRPEPF